MDIIQVCKTYKSKNKEEVKAIHNFSVSLREKGLVFVVGPSGSGKTTLLNLIGGLDRADSGEIIVNGNDITKYNERELNEYRGRRIGFVFQEYNVINHLSVYENIQLSQSVLGMPSDETEMNELLESLGILDLKNRRADEISGGQRQRVAIARALLKKSEIILADEPTGALDEETSNELMRQIKRVSKRSLVIVISHDKELARKYADRIIELSNGEIVSDDTTEDVPLQSIIPIQELNIGQKTEASDKVKIKTIFKIGIHGSFNNKARLFSFVFAIICSMTLLTIILSSVRFDSSKVFVQSMYSSSNKMLFSSVDENEYSLLEANMIGEYENFRAILSGTIINYNVTNCFYSYDSFSGLLELTPNASNVLGFNLLYGEYPILNNEVLITEYQYRYFKEGGYIDYDTGQILPVTTYDDLIGKKIGSLDYYQHDGGFIITGIIDTHCETTKFDSLQKYNSLLDIPNNDYSIYNAYMSYLTNSPHTLLYISPGSLQSIQDSINMLDFSTYITGRSDIQLYDPAIDEGGMYYPLNSISKSNEILYTKKNSTNPAINLQFPYEIYWENDEVKSELTGLEIIVSLDSLMNFTLIGDEYSLKHYYKQKLSQDIQSFVASNFNLVENQLLDDFANPTESDYFNYIFFLQNGEDNKYQPGMNLDYFTENAQEYTIDMCFSNAFPNLKVNTGLRNYDKYVDIIAVYTLRDNNSYNFVNTTFVSDSLFSEIVPAREKTLVMSLSGNYLQDVRLTKATATFDSSQNNLISFSNYIVDDINQSYNIIQGVSSILKYILILFSILTLLLLISFFSNNVAEDKSMLIIFRSLGIRKIDIMSIYFVRSLFLFTLILLATNMGSYVVVNIINRYLVNEYLFCFNPIIFDISTFFLIFIACVLIIAFSSLITIYYVSRERLGKVL
ncbi:MAG: ABC transporter ATP-binding protein/permease [Candidatus Izemoplasmatales bacterium]|nr:ABC transporter ATP-binding protein/permease [Candidatus Izemoplasmatales bacterium]